MALLPQDPQKQKQIAAMIVPVLAAVLYWNFIYVPQSADVDELQMRVENLASQNTGMRVIVARHGTDLPHRLTIFQEHVRQLEELIPRREDVPVLIHQITQRAMDTGVELAVIRPGEEQAGDFYTLQTFQLQVVGNYHNIGDYLTAIGSLARVVRPFDVGLRVEHEPKGEAPVLRASFRIETYVMPIPAPPEANNAKT
jgi:type IV pilus assembly protein PilO